MKRVYFLIKTALRWVVTGAAVATQWVLFAMAMAIFYDVILRYVFNRPTIWTMEISEYALVFLVLIGTAEVQKQKAHIRMDYLHAKFSSGMRRYLDLLFFLLMALFSFLLFWTSFKMALTAYRYGFTSNSLLETPLFIPYLIVPVGICLLLLQVVIDIIESFKEIISRRLMKRKGYKKQVTG